MDFLFDQDRQEWTTLTQTAKPRRRRWGSSLAVSTGIHVAVGTVLCWPALPIFLHPSFVARGEGGNATPVAITLYLPNDAHLAAQNRPSLLSLPTVAKKKPQKSRLAKRTNTVEQEKPTGDVEAGSQSGSAYGGPVNGDEVKPALPVTFRDLKIPRSELPPGVEGTVIVEVTIDAAGNVVEEKLVQGIGHGVDERAIAVLRDWHFRPATRNGVAIPEKQNVYFHFPS
jgi:TonB family protein